MTNMRLNRRQAFSQVRGLGAAHCAPTEIHTLHAQVEATEAALLVLQALHKVPAGDAR